MLNITTSISLSSESEKLIQTHKSSQNNSFTQASWSRIVKSVKNEISEKLFGNQGLKCVYCERYLIGLGHEIDHFAHKGDYPEFTFSPENLFYSCKFCNSPERKGQKNTVATKNPQYNKCTFLIVHPFFDDPTIEIIFTDTDRIYFDRQKCTQHGKDTIDFFRWDDLLYSTIRARTLINERLNPLTSQEEKELIQLSISYK